MYRKQKKSAKHTQNKTNTNVGNAVFCSLVVFYVWHTGKQMYLYICNRCSLCECESVSVYNQTYCLHTHLFLEDYFCQCVYVSVYALAVAVWCRPIKTGEIDDQGLWVAAVAVADSCFLQTTGNEMPLFSWCCQHQHHRATKTNYHLTAATGLLLHLPTACSLLSVSLSFSNSTRDYFPH